ncbi:hypothetical protein AYL99_08801 [Fonsecaea erecta]|uniref:Uncharacterized protein n=1 Tax=Fonsecaea erecta TaxID=1367422 RepID=A0A178ZA87_9EURO|nr:hypothetical protein AYL99_08801 [Fonsecaea erecta]OAP56689.1 hypothetical protein AYL99_08801 [Fonsecaea erecta]
MASLLAQSQLSKPLSLNAPGVVVDGPNSIPIPMQSPPPQQPFPDYSLGYDPSIGVKFVTQEIPAQPTNGQHSSHPFHMLSGTNLHPVLFQLDPYPSTYSSVGTPLLVNQATNQVEQGNKGRNLRYFSHLPRWISHNVSGMFMELWLRLDSRVDMGDILARIYVPPGTTMPQINTFNMRRMRFRECILTPPFMSGRQHPSAMEVDLISKRTREQLLLNTSMTVDLPNNRLLKPVLVNDRSIIGYVDSGLPIDYFLRGFPTPVPVPSDQQMLVLELRKRMQTVALRRGLGNGPDDYRLVPTDLHPAWWHKNAARDVIISDVDNKTHAKWIAEKLEEYPGVTRSGAQRTRGPVNTTTSVLLPPTQSTDPSSVTVSDSAQPAPMSPTDPRLTGVGAAALGMAAVSAQSLTNSDGGTSYYVEDAHQRGYEDDARS